MNYLYTTNMYFSITVTVLQNNIFYVHPVDLIPFFFYGHISELVSQCSGEKEVCIKSDYIVYSCLLASAKSTY